MNLRFKQYVTYDLNKQDLWKKEKSNSCLWNNNIEFSSFKKKTCILYLFYHIY